MPYNRFGLHPATAPWERWCERLGITVVEASTPDIAGTWLWFSESKEGEQSFHTRLDAAEDAIRTRYPQKDWRDEVANEDTTAGYLDWLATQIEDETDATPPTPVPFGLAVTRNGGAVVLTSSLAREFAEEDGTLDGPAQATVDALESLLLALAAEGLDITAPQVTAALETAVDACCQRLA